MEEKTAPAACPYPEEFLSRMREQLGERYESYIETTAQPPVRGIRMNPLKTCGEGGSAALAFPERMAGKAGAPGDLLGPVPWAEYGYELAAESEAGKSVYHAAGCYYLQEPSAMAPAQMLLDALDVLRSSPAPGRHLRVLDLCTAPGGKSTQLAAGLDGRGILVSNEIHPARAKILSENMERMGVRNALVVSESPDTLAQRLEGFFDAALVDAPCSGEGMFRRDPEARAQWSPENVRMCAQRQEAILDAAARMIRPGGVLVYSTCTFAPEEDEGSIARFLERNPDFTCREQKRLWPMEVRGEGHFAALLLRRGDPEGMPMPPMGGWEPCLSPEASGKDGGKSGGKGGGKTGGKAAGKAVGKRQAPGAGKTVTVQAARKCLEEFLGENLKPDTDVTAERLLLFGDSLWQMPQETPTLAGMKVLRCGLQLGSIRGDRLEPAHALALTLSPGDVQRVMDLSEAEAARFVHGESLPAPDASAGWTLVCACGCSLGWGKVSGGILKNHYPKGLRK